MQTKDGTIEKLKQDLYQANLEVTLKVPLELYTSRTNHKSSGTLKQDEKAIIELSDDEKWCFIRGNSGTKGWFEVKDFSMIANSGMQATEVFDGLNNAG